MKVVPLEGTTMTVLELADLARGEVVVLTRDGQPLVSVRSVAGPDCESESLAGNPRFTSLIEESRRSHRDKGGVGLEQLRQELGLEPGATEVAPQT